MKKLLACGLIGIGVVLSQHAAAQPDSSFAALQARGKMAMGVDQYASAHRFDITADGGRIALEMKGDDSLSVAQIRAHLKLIELATDVIWSRETETGDFSTPEFVHLREMRGTAVMSAKKEVIKYIYADLPRGGEVRITSSDPEALAAIREFIRAQRGDHHAGGHGGIPPN